MKRTTIFILIGIVSTLLAVSAFAHGPGWGRGGHMMDYGRNTPGYGEFNQEQRSRLDQLDRKFYDDTRGLRDDLWSKSSELNALMNTKDPDPNKAKALQKEISDLRAKLDEKQLNYEIEVRKMIPESERYGGYYDHHMGGYGGGMGYGGHMGGYGPGMDYGAHMGGYGPGNRPCW